MYVYMQAVAESRKEVRPGERVKQLVLELGKLLISSPDIMAPLVTKLSELEVEYEVVDTSAAPPLIGHAPLTTGTNDDNVVLWKRCVTERNVDSNAKVKLTFKSTKIIIFCGPVPWVHHSS